MLYDLDGGDEHFYYKSDFDGSRFDYLRSDKLEPLSLTFGDYLEITFTGDIYCEPIYPPNCYMDCGEIISIKKTEHKTEQTHKNRTEKPNKPVQPYPPLAIWSNQASPTSFQIISLHEYYFPNLSTYVENLKKNPLANIIIIM
jgi:hypothetical protein